MATKAVREGNLIPFLSCGSFSERYASIQKDENLGYALTNGESLKSVDIKSPRGPMSIKSFSFPSRELVAQFPLLDQSSVSEESENRRMIVGVRPCELRAIEYMDRIFNNPPVVDPFYAECRKRQFIVSVDCVEPHETCFCNLVEGEVYATEGFDLNLSPIEGAYIVEAGTEAGRELMEKADRYLEEASEEQLAARDRIRQETKKRLEDINSEFVPQRSPDQALADAEDKEIWERMSVGCVECGACTQICPTCHCFYLTDEHPLKEQFERRRAWDSCIWSGYSRMAGAPANKPNPRSRFRTRFSNRFMHKYVWSPKQWDMLGCVGCGRCIEGCPGRIDLRAVIREVSA